MQEEKVKHDILWAIQLLIICGIVIWMINPISENIKVLFLLTFSWIVITSLKYGLDFLKIFIRYSMLPVFLLPLLLLLYSLSEHSEFSGSYILYIIILSIGIFYVEKNDKWTAIIVPIVAFSYFAVISVNTLILYQTRPTISRILAYGDIEKIEQYGGGKYRTPFIGGYSIVYGLVMSLPVILSLARNKFKLIKICDYTLIILYSLLILFSQYFIALIIFMIVIIDEISLRQSNPKKKTFVFLFLSLLLTLLFGFGPAIANYIADLPSINDNISLRLKSIANVLNGQDVSGTDIQSRGVTYSISINSFLNNILIGAGDINNVYIGYGNHSTILDAFSKYGLIGGLAFLLYYITPIKILLNTYSKQFSDIYKNSLFPLLVLAAFNRADTRVNICLFYIVIPLVIFGFLLDNNQNQEY